MNPLNLDHLQALAEAASEGPWQAKAGSDCVDDANEKMVAVVWERRQADRALIAEARTALAKVVGEGEAQ
jgi:hypothetical protein